MFAGEEQRHFYCEIFFHSQKQCDDTGGNISVNSNSVSAVKVIKYISIARNKALAAQTYPEKIV